MKTFLALLVVCSAACAPRLPRAPTIPSQDESFSAPQNTVPAGLAKDSPEPLRLLPGDVVTLHMMSRETDDQTGIVVDERGFMHIPLAGDVQVGGLKLSEAERRVEEALSRFHRVLTVSLTISESAGHQATVVGAVRTPSRIRVAPGTRVADLVAMAGGPLVESSEAGLEHIADLDAARLIRKGSAVPVSIRLALRGHPRHNVRVRAGDHLYVPARVGQRVIVLGAVDSARTLPYRPGIRLSEALALAGGLAENGDRSDIHIVRGPLKAPQVYRTSLRALVDGKSSGVELAAGDIVYVTEEWTGSAGEVIERLSPLLSIMATGAVTGAVLATQ